MTADNTAYHLKKVRHCYGSKTVLNIPELKIGAGSITGIMGPNGGGKSTLLKLLAFSEKPSFGEIYYKGKPEQPFSPAVRSKVTLLTQKPYLLKRSVFDNIAYGLKIRKDTQKLPRRVHQSLETVGLDPKSFASRKWHELSGGEAQRVALAARLVLKPDVLLLDEPIASVDSKSAKLIREASLFAREQLGTTLVIVSHDIQWLYSISDRQMSIYNGNLFTTGMENLIPGPFVPSDNNKTVIKQTGDGQEIVLSAPKAKTAGSVIIRKKHLALDLEKQDPLPHLNQLDAQMLSMMLEKKTGFILATAAVQDLTFSIRLTQDQVRHQNLFPGCRIVIKFNADDVEWI